MDEGHFETAVKVASALLRIIKMKNGGLQALRRHCPVLSGLAHPPPTPFDAAFDLALYPSARLISVSRSSIRSGSSRERTSYDGPPT
jgi:hypothetical protein